MCPELFSTGIVNKLFPIDWKRWLKPMRRLFSAVEKIKKNEIFPIVG